VNVTETGSLDRSGVLVADRQYFGKRSEDIFRESHRKKAEISAQKRRRENDRVKAGSRENGEIRNEDIRK